MIFKKKRLTYFYDTENCSYHEAEFSLRSFLRKLASYGLFSVFMCVAAVFVYKDFMFKQRDEQLSVQKADLIAYMQGYNDKLDQYEISLNRLLENNNNFYTPIVEGEAISSTYWEGGRGGSSRYDSDKQNMFVQLENRFEVFRHRIELLRKRLHIVEMKATLKGEELQKMPCILPIKGNLISEFGHRNHPITGFSHLHTGLDFACEIGTPVHATGDGLVSFSASSDNGYGLHIDIDHGNGYKTKYAHLSEIVVSSFQKVKRGDLIGYSGNTGRSTGPHLHYELIFHDIKIDPIDFIYDLLPTDYKRMKLASDPMH